MPDLEDGETIEIKGSARLPYVLRNVGGVYSCTCPAWRNQSLAIERRTCKHLRALRGAEAEQQRTGEALPPPAKTSRAGDSQVPGLLLAETWANDVDLAGWWMSEKLDGVRAYWDGSRFLSRQGNPFHAPDWFTAALPSLPLDGELWLGRKAFQRTVSIVRRQDRSQSWREIRYVVFDLPSVAAPFEERLEQLRDSLASNRPPFALAHQHSLCQGLDHLRSELARLQALGGEGLMLRQPASRYEAGRSSTLVKVKTFHDAEARVLEHLPGTGRHKGRLGALLVELPDGTQFSIGTGFSDAQRDTPPPVGSSVTFRYQELSDRGVPRFPSFVRVRRDAGGSSSIASADPAPGSAVRRGAAHSTAVISKPQPPTETTAMPPRHFEFAEGSSSKFWEVSIAGSEVTVRFGRIGTAGQTKTKSFDDSAAAQRHAEKLVEEKTGKGYRETA